MFLGRVNVAGGVDLDDWLEVRLVTTAAGDWLMVSWAAATGDWLEVCWVEAAGDWLAVRWSAGEGDWLEVCWVAGEGDRLKVRWVAGAEFGLSWHKVSVYSSFWVDKIWIDAFGANTELLWSPISYFLMILVDITDSTSATNPVSESFIIFSMPPSSSLLTESNNAKILPVDNLSILTSFLYYPCY